MKWTTAVAGLILVCATSASAQKLDVKIIDRQDKKMSMTTLRSTTMLRLENPSRFRVQHSRYSSPMAG
jgi:hypothetical protein